MTTSTSINPLMEPTHGGVKMTVGTDATGLHIIIQSKDVKLDWHVQKYPDTMVLGMDKLITKTEPLCVWNIPHVVSGLITEEPKSMFNVHMETKEAKLNIKLNLDELLRLKKILRTHFCYT